MTKIKQWVIGFLWVHFGIWIGPVDSAANYRDGCDCHFCSSIRNMP